MKKLATVGSLIVTSTLVFSSMPFQNAHADTTSMNVSNKQSQNVQNHRPYGGVVPQGMTQAQYTELEKALPQLSAGSNMQDYNMKLYDATQNIADKYNVIITTNVGVFKPHAVRDMNGHALPLTKDGNFYQTNVDANGINHGGSEMVQNKTGHMSQQGHMNQNTHMNQSNKKVLPAAGESMTSSILTASIAALLLVSGLFLAFRRRSTNK
ncbi:TPA: LPXTG cell wall anchor domain-containing protein [Staphylococcus aureus]|uniref:LPXTG cell wall anchor domain-containing protein n=1 Tax=Staphylococcus aureus TaxID=1280 RepID=UPI00229E80A7|nr:LPXTG cell wall anchor domain-containing protein [Staphylococcus aureus]MEB8332966.1 LPXTG cell wall anchor domain-containing protein [Staphylococcus aureus]HCY6856418.1 LPXTG cell wall anchor domain-containing protein [Staphylococcus aureus]HCY6856924.1 LPXTG cell wall anchor domain-containing protein [Staphylococcus aureus]HDA7956740.1 LPXTG cell wall anchor domain-containing protein [Staphylococcus aureus]HDA7959378.1 LPXTG cell wall anchor domain-containing protein [Staphylococcus aureu